MATELRRILRGPKGSVAVERFPPSTFQKNRAFTVRYAVVGETVLPRNFTNPVQVAFGATFDETNLQDHGWVELELLCTATHCDPECQRDSAPAPELAPKWSQPLTMPAMEPCAGTCGTLQRVDSRTTTVTREEQTEYCADFIRVEWPNGTVALVFDQGASSTERGNQIAKLV